MYKYSDIYIVAKMKYKNENIIATINFNNSLSFHARTCLAPFSNTRTLKEPLKTTQHLSRLLKITRLEH